MGKHVSDLNTETADPHQLQHLGVCQLLGSLLQLFNASRLNLLNLILYEPQMRHLTCKLGRRTGWDRTSLRRPRLSNPLRRFAAISG